MPIFRPRTPAEMPAEQQAMLLTMTESQRRSIIGQEDIKKAAETLQKYKNGKANLENRIIEDEMWWELRHWEAVGRKKNRQNEPVKAQPSSAWLFNAILNYGEFGAEPDFDYMLGIAWDFIKPRLNRDRERYEDICEKRRQAVLTRWEKQHGDTNVYK